MEINKQNYFNILQANLGFETIETPIGKAIKVSPRTAFIYSCVTGAGYLDNPSYLFTPKGLLKLFYNAFDYKFVTGIFDNTTLKNTPYILSQAKPYLFNGDKFIVPVEFTKEAELSDFLHTAHSSVTNPQDYVIQRIESSKSGNGMEPFLEYLVAEYFKNKGFIVENQIPLAHAIGSPDFGGYGLSDLIRKVSGSGLLNSGGFHIIELAMLRVAEPSKESKGGAETTKLIVGEAKTGTTTIEKQLRKYIDTGLFDTGYEIHPSKSVVSNNAFGLVNFNDDYHLQVSEPSEIYTPSYPLSKQDYTSWLSNYMKFYLAANLSNDELNEWYLQKFNKKISTQNNIVNLITNSTIEELLEKIK